MCPFSRLGEGGACLHRPRANERYLAMKPGAVQRDLLAVQGLRSLPEGRFMLRVILGTMKIQWKSLYLTGFILG